jgi:hypothetical protein
VLPGKGAQLVGCELAVFVGVDQVKVFFQPGPRCSFFAVDGAVAIAVQPFEPLSRTRLHFVGGVGARTTGLHWLRKRGANRDPQGSKGKYFFHENFLDSMKGHKVTTFDTGNALNRCAKQMRIGTELA